MINTNADYIKKTIYLKVKNGIYYGQNNYMIPHNSESGNSLLWYINEHGYRSTPKLKPDETLHTMEIIVPKNWRK